MSLKPVLSVMPLVAAIGLAFSACVEGPTSPEPGSPSFDIIGTPTTVTGSNAVCPRTGDVTDGSNNPWVKFEVGSGDDQVEVWAHLEWSGRDLTYSVGTGEIEICIKYGNSYTIYRVTGYGQISVSRDISHIAYRVIREPVLGTFWCSPGFWKNNATKKDASAWPVDPYLVVAPWTPLTLLEALDATGGNGPRANAVATYLSELVFGEQAGDQSNHNCPLNQAGEGWPIE